MIVRCSIEFGEPLSDCWTGNLGELPARHRMATADDELLQDIPR